MHILDQINGQYSAPEFEWKDRYENMHKTALMHTKHLFHAIRLIWNHLAPQYLKLHPYEVYDFDKFYTEEYMLHGLVAMWHELSKRDLNEYQMNTLQRMAERTQDLKEFLSVKAPSDEGLFPQIGDKDE